MVRNADRESDAWPMSSQALFEPDGAHRLVLHVGSGPLDPELLHPLFRTPQWRQVRLDIDPQVQPDVASSITQMTAVPSASCDAVWSSNNLEHLYTHEVPAALGEFRRVLKPDGFALVAVPDLQVVARAVAEDRLEETLYVSPAGAVTPLDMLFGYRPSLKSGNQFMAHHTGFTARSLRDALLRAGFGEIELYQGEFEILALGRIKPAGV